MTIELSDADLRQLLKPVRGRGGFQTLLRRLQRGIHGRMLTVSREDLETMIRYSFAYGRGGFEERTKRPLRRRRGR